MGDFDGDKLLAVLMDLEQVAKEDIEAREKQTGQTDKTGRDQLDELHNAIQKVNEFNAFNYRDLNDRKNASKHSFLRSPSSRY